MPKRAANNTGIGKEGSGAAKMASFILIAKVISFLMLALAFIFVIRILGPDNYGLYTEAVAVAGIMATIGNFGIATAITKFLPEQKAKKDKKSMEKTLADSFGSLFVIGIMLSVITFFISGLLASSMHNLNYGPVIALASFLVLASVMSGVGSSALIGLDKGREFAIMIVVMTALQAGLAISFALLGYGAFAPLIALIVSYFGGFLVSLFYVYYKTDLKIVAPSFLGIKRMVKFSWPIGLSGLIGSAVNNLIFIVLGIFAVSAVIGNFGAASKVAFLLDIVITSVSTVLLPSFSGSLARGESKKNVGKFYSYSVYVSFLVMAPMLMVLIVLAVPVSFTAFSGAYSLAPLYIQIFAIGLLIGIFGIYTQQLLVSVSRVKDIIKYNLIVAAIELALIPVLIPTLGGFGAALLLYLFSPLLIDIFFIYAVRKEFQIRVFDGRLLRVVLANLAIGALLLPLLLLSNSYLALAAATAILIFVYPPLLIISGGVTQKEIRILRNVTVGIWLVNWILLAFIRYASLFARR